LPNDLIKGTILSLRTGSPGIQPACTLHHHPITSYDLLCRSCAGKLPPACQTFDSAYPPQCNTRSYSLREQGSTEGYYGGGGGGDDYKGGDKPYKKQALQMFAPVCASPGAAYAWVRQCVVTAQAGSTCTGAALCQPGGAITTALATCTATGWTVTNGCAPAACALAPVLPAGSNIAAFTACQVPGALGQVGGGASSAVLGYILAWPPQQRRK
jgi:hypothetical protein